MKKFLLIVFAFAYMQIMLPPAFAQQDKVSVNLKNVSVKEFFRAIERQTVYKFSYREAEVSGLSNVSVTANSVMLKDLLNAELGKVGLDWSLVGDKLVVTKAAPQHDAGAADSKKFHGIVLDANSQPVIGAGVVIEGTSKGVTTDLDGNFTFSDLKFPVTLLVSSLGYKEQRVILRGNEPMPYVFNLEDDTRLLDEAVVVGYGTMRRSLVSSAISKMSVDEGNLRQVTSPAELLNGRVAGVSVSTGSGNVGSGERMTIRGISSISAGNEPLYVIDGIPIKNEKSNIFNLGEDMSSLSSLNITDIESIEILKDAASAAIYGSRASNGVVIITTKSGRAGTSRLNVNLTAGVAQFANPGRLRLADSDLFLQVYNEGVDNYNNQYGYVIGDSKYKEHWYNPFGAMPDYNWLSAVTRLAKNYGADVSFSGGNNRTNFYVGANYNHMEGVIITNRLDKMNFKVKVNHDFREWLTVGANVTANYLKNHQVPGADAGTNILGRTVLQRPFDRPYAPDGSYYTGGTNALTYHNALQIINEERAYVETQRFLGQFYADLKFFDQKVSFKNSLNLDIIQNYDYTYYNANHPYSGDGGRIVDGWNNTQNYLFESVLNYNDKFGDFNINAMAGHSFQKISDRNILLDGRFPNDGIGATIRETAEIAKMFGLKDAINLDGGGSSTLWVRGLGVISHPYDNKRYDSKGQRIVPNFIYAR